MQKFIFTFGLGTPLKKRCQPIIANNMEDARAKMFEIYGSNWAFGYTESEWNELIVGVYKGVGAPEQLEPILCGEYT